jgi:hypothetical protein
MINLFTVEIADRWVRTNFQRLIDFFREQPIIKANFVFREFTFTAGVTRQDIAHRLGFTPKDVLVLSVSDDADVTFHPDAFTTTYIQTTVTKACTVRCLIGRYEDSN